MTDADAVEQLVELIRPLLAGRAPGIQGAALADLTAIWVAGHIILGKRTETEAMRERLLMGHMDMVRELIRLNPEAA